MRNIINLTIGGLFNAVKNVAERSGFIKRGDNTRDLRGEEVTTSVPTDIPTATPEEKYKKFQAGRSKTQEPEIEIKPEPEIEKSNSKIENHQGWPIDKYMKMGLNTPAVSNLPYYPKENVPNLSHEEYLLKTDRLFDISKLDDTIYVDEVSSKSYFLLKSKDLDINLANEVFKTHIENLDKLSDKHDILALLKKPDKDRTSQEKNILFSFSKSGTFLSEFTGEILKHRKENNFDINPNWEKQSRELQKKINKKLEVDENNDSFKIDITYSSYPR
jgi:hypothetical protein